MAHCCQHQVSMATPGTRLVLHAHLVSFLRVLGELVVLDDLRLVLRGPVADPHPSEFLRALLGESGG